MLEAWDNAVRRANAPCNFFFSTTSIRTDNLDEALDHFWDSQRAPAIAEEKAPATWGQKTELPPATAEELATRLFADRLIRGVVEHRDELDRRITQFAQNWDLKRMAVVDRNILRLAIYEMLHPRGHPAHRQHQRGGGHRQKILHRRTAANSSTASWTRSRAN